MPILRMEVVEVGTPYLVLMNMQILWFPAAESNIDHGVNCIIEGKGGKTRLGNELEWEHCCVAKTMTQLAWVE